MIDTVSVRVLVTYINLYIFTLEFFQCWKFCGCVKLETKVIPSLLCQSEIIPNCSIYNAVYQMDKTVH